MTQSAMVRPVLNETTKPVFISPGIRYQLEPAHRPVPSPACAPGCRRFGSPPGQRTEAEGHAATGLDVARDQLDSGADVGPQRFIAQAVSGTEVDWHQRVPDGGGLTSATCSGGERFVECASIPPSTATLGITS